MSDYPMLISNKLHSFRNFSEQIYVFFLKGQALKTEVSHKKDCSSLIPYIL